MAIIRIDPDRQLGRVDRRLFGQFIEHLGRCIYGGIFDEGAPLADQHGFRTDVLDAARALRAPILRWPGGNFVSGYHWTEGVGPREKRPRRLELAWHAEESNHFGTDEFIQYCRALGAEPYICVNMGSGTMDEAQAWVEYCNGTGDTSWANLRRANGHLEPYNVRYWGLGNEMYGAWQIGASTADQYVDRARQFASIMKMTDPTIELVSCGQWGWTDWDRIVIDALAAYVRYHSIHLYTGSSDYRRNVLMVHQAERGIRICETLIERARYQQHISHPIGIAFDEWNIWYRTRADSERRAGLEEQYDLSDAIGVATWLNIFLRHCRSVEIANYAQMVNVIAPIFTKPDAMFLQTVYHPLQLYAEHHQPIALDVYVESARFEMTAEDEARDVSPTARDWKVSDLGPFQVLDVSATCDPASNTVCLAVVNRSPDEDISATISIDRHTLGPLTVHELNGADPHVRNSFEEPDAVSVNTTYLSTEERELHYTFPAHSVVVLRGQYQLMD